MCILLSRPSCALPLHPCSQSHLHGFSTHGCARARAWLSSADGTVDVCIDLAPLLFVHSLSLKGKHIPWLWCKHSLVTLLNHFSFRVNKCFQLSYVRTQERGAACFKHVLSFIHILKCGISSLFFRNRNHPGVVGLLAKLFLSTQTPVEAGVFIGVHGVGDDRKGDAEVTSVASQKANEPVTWHIWCLSLLCHDSFTRMSVNSPTTSCEIGCGQSVSDETCVKVTLTWLVDETKWCLYKEETRSTRCQRLWCT